METTDMERLGTMHGIGAVGFGEDETVGVPCELLTRLIADADRLARLEDGIRALADRLLEETESHDPYKPFDEYNGGIAYKAEEIEQELRALLDGE